MVNAEVSPKVSKTKTSFYRRIYVTDLIESGINTVPALMAGAGMPRRTAQDTIVALKELGIEVVFQGGTKNGHYEVVSWGAINRAWVEANLDEIRCVLGY